MFKALHKIPTKEVVIITILKPFVSFVNFSFLN